ncbi:MAG: hypothetical protein VZT48_08465 [Bulleidia sp.]|nr:hypothetical protein [Bulleidia sp.]
MKKETMLKWIPVTTALFAFWVMYRPTKMSSIFTDHASFETDPIQLAVPASTDSVTPESDKYDSKPAPDFGWEEESPDPEAVSSTEAQNNTDAIDPAETDVADTGDDASGIVDPEADEEKAPAENEQQSTEEITQNAEDPQDAEDPAVSQSLTDDTVEEVQQLDNSLTETAPVEEVPGDNIEDTAAQPDEDTVIHDISSKQ